MADRDHPADRPTDPARRALLGSALSGAAAATVLGAGTASAQLDSPLAGGFLAGQVALITGGARGIGRAIAVALADAGADIGVVDILQDIPGLAVPLATEADLVETRARVEATGRRFAAAQADVRDFSALAAAVDTVRATLGPIDVAVANAGVNSNVSFVDDDQTAWDHHWTIVTDVNVRGAANTLRLVLPEMTARGRGRVIVIASTFGRQGNGSNPAYVTSKWAVVGMAKAAAIDVGRSGVTVNAIAPTAVRTGLGGPRTPAERAASDDWLRANYHQLDVGLLEPEDIAPTAVYLASPAAAMITGATIDVAAGANARYTA